MHALDAPFPVTDRQRALSQGSPTVASLILALSGAVAGRVLVGRVAPARLIRARAQ